MATRALTVLRRTFALLGLCLIVGCPEPPAAAPSFADREFPEDAALRKRLDRIIAFTGSTRHLTAEKDSAWQLVHGILAYGHGYQIRVDGQLVPALQWLTAGGKLPSGGQLNGWRFESGDHPNGHSVRAVLEPGSMTGQGHPDQWVGYLSQCGLGYKDAIVLAGKPHTVRDLVTQAQWDAREGVEASWTLMAFATYLPLDTQWQAKDGSQWSIERLVELETKADINNASCGGTHRLYALSVAVNRYRHEVLKDGEELPEVWQAADLRVLEAIDTARRYQQPDGSFSTSFFQRPGSTPDLEKQISSTGHILELLSVSLTDEQLQEPWVKAAVVRLCDLLDATQDVALNCGALYHAAHALQIYRARCFESESLEAVDPPEVAGS